MSAPDQVEVIQSNKGHYKIIYRGFMYTRHKSFSNVTRWRCAARGTCRGSIMTNNDFSKPIPKMPHTHREDHTACEMAKTRYFMPKVTKDKDYSKQAAPDTKEILIESSSQDQFMQTFGLVQLQSPGSSPPAQLMPKAMSPTSPVPTKRSQPPVPPPQHRPVQIPKPEPKAETPEPPAEVCLRWNSYHSNMQTTFPSLLNNEQFVDVTLACDGRSIKCHKVMLSACSPYLEELLSSNPCQHPIIFLKDMKFWQLAALVDFMYRGEVNVTQDKLPSLLSAAEALQIKGLASPPSSSRVAEQPESLLSQFQSKIKAELDEEYMQDTDDSLPPLTPKTKKRKMSDGSNMSGNSYQTNGKKPKIKKDVTQSDAPQMALPTHYAPPPSANSHRHREQTTMDNGYQTYEADSNQTGNGAQDDISIDDEEAQMILEQYSQQNDNYSKDGDGELSSG